MRTVAFIFFFGDLGVFIGEIVPFGLENPFFCCLSIPWIGVGFRRRHQRWRIIADFKNCGMN
jgi:hypothetical protein